ncbi:hypothetical protein [Hymenobacter sp. CRA2]|uniref:hypothetical protein n=1 Tax=Hymenobacter sp. CRA2 TaxID=1955620 RepID=UPI00098F54D0|nr:hypothetical protein [Hymenobacter sp. CRA2]OON68744.1 hypothetical protein B0919_11175 [Hymenobacter sp. CRA2]
MMPTATEFFDLRYGPEPDVLRLRWQRALTMGELKHGYAQAHGLAVRLLAARWFIDSRSRPLPPPPEQSAWLHQEFLPSLYPYFAEPMRLACLMTPDQFYALRNDAARTAQVQHLTAPDQPFWMAFFDDETRALRWLQA